MLALLAEGAPASTTTRIIVKRESGLSAAERADIRADAGVRLLRTLSLPRTEVVTTTDPRDALATLRRDGDVVYAEPDHVRRLLSDPDPDLGELWAFDNTGQDFGNGQGTPGADSDVISAWDLASGDGEIVGVVDTGIYPHADLAGQVLAERTFVGTGPDVDGAPDTPSGHGTHISGTIAAVYDNGEGAAGIAPNAKLLALKALGSAGSGFDSDIVDAFHYAALQGAHVVNASFAGPGTGKTLRAAIAANPGVLFVAGAGNDGTDNDATPQYPCNVPEPNVLCVGASDNTDQVAAFEDGASNVGATSVDLFAPGKDIYSTMPPFVHEGTTYHYGLKDGTSMAVPHVAGAAALVMELLGSPTPSPAEVKQILMVSGDDVAAEFDAQSVSGRRLDARAALDVVSLKLGGHPTALDADADLDGWADEADACPTVNAAGSPDGCPRDDDWDGVLNDADNCDVDVNPNQANADRDDLGDVCDPTRYGHNNDGDHLWEIHDACPNTYGTLSNGCPAPTPPPPSPPNTDHDDRLDSADACPTEYAISNDGCPLAQVAALAAKPRTRGTRRSASVTVVATRWATMRITVERRKGSRWVRVARRTVTGTQAKLRLTRLRRGSHRVRVSISSNAGAGTSVSKRFRVR